MYEFFKVMTKQFDSKKAYDNVRAIHSFCRWISYDKIAQGADFCKAAMLEAGLSDVEKRELKADGKTVYNDRMLPRAWCAKSAALIDDKGEVLCDYQKIPCSLSMYSAPTPKGGITAELAVVNDLNDNSDADRLKGKILLVNCGSAGAVKFAQKVGAAGILCDTFPMFPGIRDSREQMKGVHRWDCLFDKSCSLFGFSLAPEQGDLLRQRAKEGPVVLHAEVDAAFTNDSLCIISGAIDGTEPEKGEIILYAHLEEPGANDNASGCGGLLELFRSLNHAIKSGLLPRPKNTLRLVLGPEYSGSLGYIYYHPNRERLCLISVDMVGSEKKDKAQMSVCLNPLSNRSYLDGAMILSKQRYNEYTGEKMELNEIPFWRMSDNAVADPSLNTPSVCLGNYPTESYHSSLDTMDRIEPDILKRNVLVAGYCAYMLAAADNQICSDIANVLKQQWNTMLSSATTENQRLLYNECQVRSLHSLNRIFADYDAGDPLQEFRKEVPAYAQEHGNRIPLRAVKGPLFFASHPEIKNNPAIKIDTVTPLNWTDGVRTIWDITLRTAIEKNMEHASELQDLYFKHVNMYACLEEYGYITFG